MIVGHAAVVGQVQGSNFAVAAVQYPERQILPVTTEIFQLVEGWRISTNDGEGIDRVTGPDSARPKPPSLCHNPHLAGRAANIERLPCSEIEVEQGKQQRALGPKRFQKTSDNKLGCGLYPFAKNGAEKAFGGRVKQKRIARLDAGGIPRRC